MQDHNDDIDYSDLVRAILENDERQQNIIIKRVFEVLVNYLLSSMQCSLEDAEDCAQQAIISTVETIREGKLKDPNGIIPYLLKCSRNNCLRLIRYNSKLVSDDNLAHVSEPANQLHNLLSEEESRILQTCMEALSRKQKNILDYIFSLPGIDADQVALKFKISTPNVWSKKHRIIQKLSECVKKKMA